MKKKWVILEGENLEKMGEIWGENGDIFGKILCDFWVNFMKIYYTFLKYTI